MRKMFNLRTFAMFFVALSLVASVVGCKDYDDDIDNLQKQLDQLKSTVAKEFQSKMDAQVATLKSEIDALKKKVENATTKEELEAAKKELVDKMVSLEVFNTFKENVLKKLEGVADAESLKAIETKIASLEGRLAALEALLKIKDGKSEVLKELADKIAANEQAIKELQEKGLTLEQLKEMLDKLGINIDVFSGTLTSVVLYPENYVMGVESIVLRPLIFEANWNKPVVIVDPNTGKEEHWGPICPEPNPGPDPGPSGCTPYGKEIKGTTKDNKQFYARGFFHLGTNVKYNVSPASIDKSMMDLDKLEVTSHLATFTRAGGVEDEGLNPFTAKFVSLERGKMTVAISMDAEAFSKVYLPKMTAADHGNYKGADLWRFFGGHGEDNLGYDDTKEKSYNTPVLALQVPHSEKAMKRMENADVDPYVTSDYVNVYVDPYVNIDIAKKGENCVRYSNLIENETRNENVPNDACKDAYDVMNAKDLADGVNVTYENNPCNGAGTGIVPADVRIVKLVEGQTLDLVDYVEAIAGTYNNMDACNILELEKYGLEWEFSLKDGADKVIKFIEQTNQTNQQEFISLLDAKKGTIEARVVGQPAQGAAVDKSPIVRVRIIDPNAPEGTCPVSEAYIKVLIVDKETTPMKDQFVGTYIAKTPVLCEGMVRKLTYVEVSENIYNGGKHQGGDLDEIVEGVGLSKDQFHYYYGTNPATVPFTGSIGAVQWILDTNEQGLTTYVPEWTITRCELNTLCGDDCPDDFEIQINSGYKIEPKAEYKGIKPVLIIKFQGKFTKQATINITEASLQAPYWNKDDNGNPLWQFVEHHSKSQTPAGNPNSADCTYKNNINAAFATNANKSLKLPGVAVTDYEYVFVKDVAKQYNGEDDELTIKVTDKQIIAVDESNVEHVVCTIIDHTATNATEDGGEDWLEYAENDVAKMLLNKSWRNMWARLQLRVKCEECPGADDVYAHVKIKGNDDFVVKFLRPINAVTESPESFEDGIRFGLKGTVLDIDKVVALEDWHKEKFKNVPSFYDYYGVTDIRIDTDTKVQWNGNGAREDIPSTLVVSWIPKSTTYPGNPGTGTDPNYYTVDELKAAVEANGETFPTGGDYANEYIHGAVTYFNNGTVVTGEFKLYVPVRVEYKWGVIRSEEVTVKVKITQTQD